MPRALLSPVCGVGIRTRPQRVAPAPWHQGLAVAGTGERAQPLSCLGRSRTSPNVDFCVPDRFPQIIQLASELEFNLGSEPVVSCVATGNPLPASDSVELRKADGTVLKVWPPCPCPTTIPMLPATPEAPVAPLVCGAAPGQHAEPGG